MDIAPITMIIQATAPAQIIPVNLDDGIDWPAWVQAFGSIAAIVATWGVTYWQGKSELRREKERSIAEIWDKLEAMVEIARAVDDLMPRQIDWLEATGLQEFFSTGKNIGELDKILGDFSISEYPYSLIAIDLLNYRESIADYLAQAADSWGPGEHRIVNLRAKASAANEQCKALQIALHGMQLELRSRAGLSK